MLFDNYDLNGMKLDNRIVMAPMTRARASEDNIVNSSAAQYYAKRASAGLIVSEVIAPSRQGQSEPNIPGLFHDDHQQAWSKVVDAVHAVGGRIFAQLMHGGRIGHSETSGLLPVAPSAVAARGSVYTVGERLPFQVPARTRR